MYRVLIAIPLFQNEWTRSQASIIASLTSACVNLILIMVLSLVYEKLAFKLTQWGRLRSGDDLPTSLISYTTVEHRLTVTSLVRSPHQYGHPCSVPNCIAQCKLAPCNTVTSPLRSLLSSVTVLVRFHCIMGDQIYPGLSVLWFLSHIYSRSPLSIPLLYLTIIFLAFIFISLSTLHPATQSLLLFSSISCNGFLIFVHLPFCRLWYFTFSLELDKSFVYGHQHLSRTSMILQFNSIQLLYSRLNSIVCIQVVHNNLRSIYID